MPRKWILVVDDDFRVRDLWVEALKAAGYAAVGAEDGMVALELIRDLFPDLILLDLRMPRLSGGGFLDAIRGHPRWKEIPILIVSAFLDQEVQAEAEKGLRILGAVQKPLTLRELIGHVAAAVGLSSAPAVARSVARPPAAALARSIHEAAVAARVLSPGPAPSARIGGPPPGRRGDLQCATTPRRPSPDDS